jgi:hypothetical protein
MSGTDSASRTSAFQDVRITDTLKNRAVRSRDVSLQESVP